MIESEIGTPESGTVPRPGAAYAVGWTFIAGGSVVGLVTLAVVGFTLLIGKGIPLEVLVPSVLGILLTVAPGFGILRGRLWAWWVATSTTLGATIGIPLAIHGLIRSSLDADLTDATELRILAGFTALGLLLLFAICAWAYVSLIRRDVRAYFGVRRPGLPLLIGAQLVAVLAVAIPAGSWLKSHLQAGEETSIQLEIDRAVGKVGHDAAAETFMAEVLQTGTEEQRAQAAWALQQSSAPDVVAVLADALKRDASASVRANAVVSLGAIGGEAVLGSLLTALEDESEDVRAAAVGGMTAPEFAEHAPRIAELVADPSASVRLMAVEYIGQQGDAEMGAKLGGLWNDPDGDIRRSVAFLLGQAGDTAAVEALIRLLDDERWDVRANAAQSLGRIGDPLARTPLRNALQDPHEQVRLTAEEALGRLR